MWCSPVHRQAKAPEVVFFVDLMSFLCFVVGIFFYWSKKFRCYVEFDFMVVVIFWLGVSLWVVYSSSLSLCYISMLYLNAQPHLPAFYHHQPGTFSNKSSACRPWPCKSKSKRPTSKQNHTNKTKLFAVVDSVSLPFLLGMLGHLVVHTQVKSQSHYR